MVSIQSAQRRCQPLLAQLIFLLCFPFMFCFSSACLFTFSFFFATTATTAALLLLLLLLLHYAFGSAKQCLRLQHLFCMADAPAPLCLSLAPYLYLLVFHGNANLVHSTQPFLLLLLLFHSKWLAGVGFFWLLLLQPPSCKSFRFSYSTPLLLPPYLTAKLSELHSFCAFEQIE